MTGSRGRRWVSRGGQRLGGGGETDPLFTNSTSDGGLLDGHDAFTQNGSFSDGIDSEPAGLVGEPAIEGSDGDNLASFNAEPAQVDNIIGSENVESSMDALTDNSAVGDFMAENDPTTESVGSTEPSADTLVGFEAPVVDLAESAQGEMTGNFEDQTQDTESAAEVTEVETSTVESQVSDAATPEATVEVVTNANK